MKKKFLGFSLLVVCLMIGVVGCPSNNNSPSSPSAPNPTNTFTSISTGTPTSSPTVTPTGTPSATATNSATPCTTVVFQATYTFDSSIDCWQVDANSPYITGYGISTTTKRTGTGALNAFVNNTSGAVTGVQVEINYPVAQNLSGASVTFYVNVDATLLASNGSSGINVFDMNTGYTNYESNNPNITKAQGGTWVQVVHNGLTNGSVIQLGIQLYNIPIGATGNIYIDDLSITVPVGPTPTPTNSPTPAYQWTYEDNGVDNWYVAWGGATVPTNSVAVTGFGYSSSYGLDLIFNGSAGDNDIQAQASNGPANFPLNFSTLNTTSVSCWVWANTSAYTGGNGQYNVAVCPYLTAGAGNTKYGGCYNGWANQNAQFGPDGVGGTWFKVTLTPSGGTWTTDETDVTNIGVEVNLANSIAADLVVDNITVY